MTIWVSQNHPYRHGCLLRIAWKEQTPYTEETDFISLSLKTQGRAPVSPAVFIVDHLRPATEAAGIQIPDGYRFGLHNLRHSLSSWLVNKGKADPKTVQSLLRHSRIPMTLDLYTQGDGDETRAAQGAFLREMGNGPRDGDDPVNCGRFVERNLFAVARRLGWSKPLRSWRPILRFLDRSWRPILRFLVTSRARRSSGSYTASQERFSGSSRTIALHSNHDTPLESMWTP